MLFKLILPLSTLLALAWAGGRTLSVGESRQFIDLFRRYCSSGRSAQNQDGNTFYYCKFSDQGPIHQELTHSADVAGGDTPKQVIFIQPPQYNYVHNVALRGSPGSPQQTDIYVLPPTADHKLQLQDSRTAVQAAKPSLFFLSNEQQPGGPTGTGSTAHTPPPPRGPSVQPTGNPYQPTVAPHLPQNPGPADGGYQYQQYGGEQDINPRPQRTVSSYYPPYTTLS